VECGIQTVAETLYKKTEVKVNEYKNNWSICPTEARRCVRRANHGPLSSRIMTGTTTFQSLMDNSNSAAKLGNH